MGGERRARHRFKELLHSLEQELRSEYGLSVIESRALVQRVAEFIEQVHLDEGEFRGPGQVRFVAVADGQPAGRPLSQCVTVQVLLSVLGPTDATLLVEQGSRALRQARLHRMVHEARQQGGLLSYEDLGLLLAVDVSTVRRLVASCRRAKLEVPTRGHVADIGPGSTHKARVIELCFRGLQPAQIAAYTAHALSSVERYLGDFSRVAELVARDYPKPAIVRITGLSPRTVRDYQALLDRFSVPAHRPVLEMLRQRFHPINVDPDKEDT
ncbi:MAG: DUF1670 domain-containing protein [bacterium]|nr:DUF1670 domain-containing protein [bacterium]